MRDIPATLRAISSGAESMIGVVHRVLDHGEVELVDYMGTDEQLARIARVSTGSGRQDTGILPYLVRMRHTSPLEFGQLVLRVRLPVFVDRQWRRHRTASVAESGEVSDAAEPLYAVPPEDRASSFSEFSMRYRPAPEGAYVPAPDFVQAAPAAGSGVKQGRGADLSPQQAEWARARILQAGVEARAAYDDLRTQEPAAGPGDTDYPGLASELARSVLTLGTFTEWYWRTDAHNLMGWLRLRLDTHAQKEIRAYGEVVSRIFAAWLPVTEQAFRRHVLLARTFSDRELARLACLLALAGGDQRLQESLDVMASRAVPMTAGEESEFRAKLAHAGQLWDVVAPA